MSASGDAAKQHNSRPTGGYGREASPSRAQVVARHDRVADGRFEPKPVIRALASELALHQEHVGNTNATEAVICVTR